MAKQLQDQMKVIAAAIKAGQYRYTVHGAQQRIARRISREEIEERDCRYYYCL